MRLCDIGRRWVLMATVAGSLLDTRGDPWPAESWEVGGFAEEMAVEMERSLWMGDLKRHGDLFLQEHDMRRGVPCIYYLPVRMTVDGGFKPRVPM